MKIFIILIFFSLSLIKGDTASVNEEFRDLAGRERLSFRGIENKPNTALTQKESPLRLRAILPLRL
ncbi:MAG: hypothetical protein ACLFQK_10545 [Fibrobacterota bacterium]